MDNERILSLERAFRAVEHPDNSGQLTWAQGVILEHAPALFQAYRRLVERRESEIREAVQGAYLPSRGGTTCRWCNVRSSERVSLAEFATWLHRAGCPVPGTIPEREAAIAAGDDEE